MELIGCSRLSRPASGNKEAKFRALIRQQDYLKSRTRPASLAKVEDAFRDVMSHPVKPEDQRENREPPSSNSKKHRKLERSSVEDLWMLRHDLKEIDI